MRFTPSLKASGKRSPHTDSRRLQALWLSKGAALYRGGRYGQALAAYGRVLRMNPGSAAAHTGKAHALRSLKRYEAALAAYGRAQALAPACIGAISGGGDAL